MFLAKAKELNIGVAEINSIKKYFKKFPDALVQFFVVNQPPAGKVNRLGDHHHTAVQAGGSGHEVFIFTEVPASTHIILEQYHLGKASGKLRYDVKSGEVMENQPNDHHVFVTDGPFQMVQILEGGFKADDLKKFNVEEWTKGDKNVVQGRGMK